MLQMYFGEKPQHAAEAEHDALAAAPAEQLPEPRTAPGPLPPGRHAGSSSAPADQITHPATDAQPGFETYFAREQSSYYWNEDVSIYASRITELKDSVGVRLVQEIRAPFTAGPARAVP